MLINCQFDAAKVAPNTKRHNFACNKLESKAKLCKIMHFKKIAEDFEHENFWNRTFCHCTSVWNT